MMYARSAGDGSPASASRPTFCFLFFVSRAPAAGREAPSYESRRLSAALYNDLILRVLLCQQRQEGALNLPDYSFYFLYFLYYLGTKPSESIHSRLVASSCHSSGHARSAGATRRADAADDSRVPRLPRGVPQAGGRAAVVCGGAASPPLHRVEPHHDRGEQARGLRRLQRPAGTTAGSGSQSQMGREYPTGVGANHRPGESIYRESEPITDRERVQTGSGRRLDNAETPRATPEVGSLVLRRRVFSRLARTQ
eukprot:6053535-Pyramimonas_sp.AAC.1